MHAVIELYSINVHDILLSAFVDCGIIEDLICGLIDVIVNVPVRYHKIRFFFSNFRIIEFVNLIY